MFVTALYKVYVIWTFYHTGNYALMKVTSGFNGHQIFNFERNLNLSRGPKAFLFRLAKFLLEALVIYTSFKFVADAVFMSDLR